jgi:ABC-2 type transport system ATP-binding protein
MASVEELCDNISLIDHARIVLQGNVDEIRASHATGTFRVVTKNSLTENGFNIISFKEKSSSFEYLLKTPENEMNNELLKDIMKQSELIAFEEILPAMNDIFINTVTSKSL